MKKLNVFLVALLVLFLLGMANLDEDEGYPWRNHEPPFNFVFENMIDSHQQTKIVPAAKEKEKGKEKEKDKLHGFLYIRYTGETTEDGYPIAERANCYDNPDECRVGWVLKGVPIEATLVQKGPRLWLVNPEDLPKEPGYSHFQWLGTPEKPSGLVVGNTYTYSGILMKRVAPAPFFWLGGSEDSSGGGCGGHESDASDEGGCGGHEGGCGGSGGSGGSDGRLVLEGVDSHSNIVTNPDDVGNGGGGCGGHNDGGGCDDGGCDDGTDDGGCGGDEGGCEGHDSGA